MLCSRRSSRWAIFCASGLSCAFRRASRRAVTSSSSSCSSSSGSRSSASSPASAFGFFILFISRLNSLSCLRKTVSRSSSSERVVILALISLDICNTCTALFTRLNTNSRRFGMSKVSSTCCRSETESWRKPTAMKSASTDGEEGQRTAFGLLPMMLPPPDGLDAFWCSRLSSTTLCCKLSTKACTSPDGSVMRRSSCKRILATKCGSVAVNSSTLKRAMPSSDNVMEVDSWPFFSLLVSA
mmetsp:Transcript_31398/g.91696  ORF Transcript_31398/g.91696 Transcript_31398/m.91696 type:complete len:241 (-) Transcript_31398:260-982(-)